MSNSKLICYTKLSPNCTKPRNHQIDSIVIHCMSGDMTIESCGTWFSKSTTKASSNYGVGSDGRIGLYVNEGDRSWCTSSRAVDHRAISIEVASKNKAPHEVTDAAYESLIILVADICQRNNIKELLWKGDKSLMGDVSKQNLVVHRWTANKSCPGDYLYSRHGDIASQVNKILIAALESKEGYLTTMTEEEFNAILNAKLAPLQPALYKSIEDVPAWGRSAVQKCLDKKIMSGTNFEGGKVILDISPDLLRVIVLNDRAGIYDK